MHRFFVAQTAISGDSTVTLDKNDSAHAARVLRLRVGDTVAVCDACGSDYDGTILDDNKDGVVLSLANKRPSETEPAARITLLQCMPKSDKLEQIIQKCVEIGVCEIAPIASVRSLVNIGADKLNARTERYNRIALEAAKQSRRGIIPRVHTLTDFASFDFSPYDMLIIAYEEEKEASLKALLSVGANAPQRIALVIGPEGGLEPQEIAFLAEKGGKTITLGKRILRTETAGPVAAAIILHELEG